MSKPKPKPERFAARVSRLKALAYLAGAIAMAALGAYVVRIPGLIATVAGWTAIAFFGLCALVAARELFRIRPVIEIGPEGLLWRRWSDQVIPWRAFTRAWVTDNVLALWLADPAAYRSRSVTGLIARLSGTSVIHGDIGLMALMLDCSFEELADAVYRHRPSLFRR